MAEIQPLGNLVLIKPIDQTEQKTASGFIIQNNKKYKDRGEIAKFGKGKEIEELGLKIGDKVIFSRADVEGIKVDGIEYTLVDCSDIIALIEE